MNLIAVVTDPLAHDFMLRALGATAVAAVVCGLLSCWLVLIGWSLMGDAVSHSVLPGVVLAHILGIPLAVGAAVFGLGAVALIGAVRSTSRVKEDAAIGTVFTTLFALGLVLVAVVPSHVDLQHVLFGNLLGVSGSDLFGITVLGLTVLAVVLVKRRDLTLHAFDPGYAHTIGLSPARLSALLLGLLAATTVVALQAVGVVLVVAMLVIPGATAYLMTDRFAVMTVTAPGLALACGVVGVYASYYLDAPTGPMVVLAQGLAFTIVYLASPRRGLIGTRLAARRRRRLSAPV